MYKILVVWALSQELNIIKEEIKNLELRNIKTIFFTTWIGNYNMILNLTKYLEQNKDFDFVINIWVCGHIPLSQPFPPREKGVAQLIQVARILNLANNKELIVPHIIDFWELESIASSEKIIYDEKELIWEKYVDMESYGFEKVCDNFSISRIILKVPVDKIWVETKIFNYERAFQKLKNNIDYKLLFVEIYKYLENIFSFQRVKNEKEIFEKYKTYFWFTFSQTEIFKRFYHRYFAIIWEDFENYFEQNKELKKKDFLKNLEVFLEGFLVR